MSMQEWGLTWQGEGETVTAAEQQSISSSSSSLDPVVGVVAAVVVGNFSGVDSSLVAAPPLVFLLTFCSCDGMSFSVDGVRV